VGITSAATLSARSQLPFNEMMVRSANAVTLTSQTHASPTKHRSFNAVFIKKPL
jgi:hypothetical protein